MMTIQLDNFILNNIFSFVTDESDRDAVYNVSRHFRRMYRHVAPSNAYCSALMCNNVHLARILFDMERIVPDYNMLALAIQRGQIDHATELFVRMQPPTIDQFRTLLICAISAHSEPLTLLVEQYSLKEQHATNPKERATDFLAIYDDDGFEHDVFVAVCDVHFPDDNRYVGFLRWLVETRRLMWCHIAPKTIARYATVPLVTLFLETRKFDRGVDYDEILMQKSIMRVLAAIVGLTHQPNSLVQQFVLDHIDRMNSESAKNMFLSELNELLCDRQNVVASIFDYLVCERGYDILCLDSIGDLVEASAIDTADDSVYLWLSGTISDDNVFQPFYVFRKIYLRGRACTGDARQSALQQFERCIALYKTIDAELIDFIFLADASDELGVGDDYEFLAIILRHAIATASVRHARVEPILRHSIVLAMTRQTQKPEARKVLHLLTRYPNLVCADNDLNGDDDDDDDDDGSES